MDTIKSLGELSLGSRLKRLSEQCMKVIKQAYAQYQINFDPYLFPAFHKIAQSTSTTNTELIEALQTSQPAVTQTINKLFQKELINLTPHPVDKRKKMISLSDKGIIFYRNVQPLWRAMDNAVKQFTRHPANSLLEHIDCFEEALQTGAFYDAIIKAMDQKGEITVINYESRFGKVFHDLNIEWLETFFYVEPFDREVLSNPDQYILDPGGYIFFAVENDEALGTVALMKAGEGNYELTKMAVRTDQRGRKIGQILMQYCIDFARKNNFRKLFLYSNTKLENAIYIYRKFGFIEIEKEADSPYERSNIKMEFPL